MSLTDDDIRHIAKLSALALSEKEIETVRGQLNEILEHVSKLDSINTAGVPPTSHVHGIVNNFRDDVVKDSLPVETALKNSKDKTKGGFRVPRII